MGQLDIIYNVFGKDAIKDSASFDLEMYHGGAFLRIIGNTIYILELSFESKRFYFYKIDGVSFDSLFSKVFDMEETHLIGEICVATRNLSGEEKLRKIIEVLYKEEFDWLVTDNNKYELFELDYDTNGELKIGKYKGQFSF